MFLPAGASFPGDVDMMNGRGNVLQLALMNSNTCVNN